MSELPPELAAIRTTAAIARTGAARVVRLRGDGARETALWALPSRVHLRDAQARQSLLLDADGRPLADVVVCADDEDYVLLIEGPIDPIAHLREHARGDVEIIDLSIDHDVIEVHGPWAWELVSEVLGSDFIALPYLNFFRLDAGFCLRAGKTGEFGYQIVTPRAETDALHARFVDAGTALDAAQVSQSSLALAGFENWFFDAAHVPAGATPIELQLSWRLAADRDYLGRAALDRRRAEATHTLVCVVAEREIAAGDRVRLNDHDIGEVTRAEFSHALDTWIAAALLRRELAHGGIDRYTANDVPVRTTAPPLIDNRSLYVDPRRHLYRTRDEVTFGSFARPQGAVMESA